MNEIVLKGRTCKVMIPLEHEALKGIRVPDDQRRMKLQIQLIGGKMTAEISTKSMRRAIAAIAEHGSNDVAIIVQGKLTPGNIVQDAGLMAQLKTPKAA